MTDRQRMIQRFRDASRRRGAIRNALDARLAALVEKIDNGTITEGQNGRNI